jgi:hypothetical protein
VKYLALSLLFLTSCVSQTQLAVDAVRPAENNDETTWYVLKTKLMGLSYHDLVECAGKPTQETTLGPGVGMVIYRRGESEVRLTIPKRVLKVEISPVEYRTPIAMMKHCGGGND